jgi:ligand-binding SRPBCC domain-containing protein
MDDEAGVLCLERTQRIESPLPEVFSFFADAANLQLITPAFLGFRILTPLPIQMETGVRIEYALSLFGVPFRWCTVIREWNRGVRFVDEQESGPYTLWHHTHEFVEDTGTTIMRDVVRYKVPLGILGRIAHGLFIQRMLRKIFDYRRDAVNRRFSQAQSSTSVVG